MCDWILEALGPERAGPLHGVPSRLPAAWTASERRPRRCWPPTTSPMKRGLQYAYVGNIQAPKQQTTYCPGCKQPLIERVGYTITRYDLNGNLCRHCGTTDRRALRRAPGNWGSRRQPVRISEFEVRPQPRIWHLAWAAGTAVHIISSSISILDSPSHNQRAEHVYPPNTRSPPAAASLDSLRPIRKRRSSERRPRAGRGDAGPTTAELTMPIWPAPPSCQCSALSSA